MTSRSSSRFHCRLAGPLRHVRAINALGLLRGLRHASVPSADDGPSPAAGWLPTAKGDTNTLPTFTTIRSTSEPPSSTPTASPRLRRRPSPWPPHRHTEIGFEVATRRWRALHPAHILQIGAGGTLTGRQALVPLVRRLVLLAGPASSGSADTSRRCQGCSHLRVRLHASAALSFTSLLRQTGGRGLSPLPGYGGASWRTLQLFHSDAADRARATYMPDTAWPVSGHPPGSSRDPSDTPVSMSSYGSRHVSSGSLAFAFPVPT